MSEKTTTEQVTVRRSPKYLRFFILGAALAAVIAFISTAVSFTSVEQTGGIPVFQLVGFFTLFAAGAGGLLGLTLALLIDYALRRRVRTANAQRSFTTKK